MIWTIISSFYSIYLLSNQQLRKKYILYPLVLFGILSAYKLSNTQDWLFIYVYNTFLSIFSSLIIYFSDKNNKHLAFKYLFYSAFANTILIIGLSYLFYINHSTSVFLSFSLNANYRIFIVAFIICVSSIFAIIHTFPFHFLIIDIYKQIDNFSVSFISTIPKISAIALLYNLKGILIPETDLLYYIFYSYALISLIIGHLGALINYNNIKHILTYGSIAQSGNLISLLLCNCSIDYYLYAYALMNISTWLLLNNKNNIVMILSLLALIGIPPIYGFIAKYQLLTSLYNHSHFLFYIIIIGTILSLYYYLKVYKMYKDIKSNDDYNQLCNIIIAILSVILTILVK